VTRVAIIGGGPGGYEAALVAAQLGAEVTVVDTDGIGGSAVLTDCVPSKTLVATADRMVDVAESGELGVRVSRTSDAGSTSASGVGVDLGAVNARVVALAQAQSTDTTRRLVRDGVRVVAGRGRLDGPNRVVAELHGDGIEVVDADVVLVATGAHPRELPSAVPDGERILSWTQVYDLDELPERLVVVGSGVTGAEFASAYHALGSDVVLVSSRERVLPGQDADAATVLEAVFERRGLSVLPRSRAVAAQRTAVGVRVELEDGRVVEGSHCLMAVGSIPNTAGLGLPEAGSSSTTAATSPSTG
jgi:NAD(P)H dehydrogenase (quinone)